MHPYVYIMQSAKHRYFHLFRGNLWCAQIFSALHHYLMCHFFYACILHTLHSVKECNFSTNRWFGLLFFSSSLTLQSSISLSHSRSPDLFNVSLITLSALFIRCITNILAAYTYTALFSLRLWQFQCKCMLFIWLKHK